VLVMGGAVLPAGVVLPGMLLAGMLPGETLSGVLPGAWCGVSSRAVEAVRPAAKPARSSAA